MVRLHARQDSGERKKKGFEISYRQVFKKTRPKKQVEAKAKEKMERKSVVLC